MQIRKKEVIETVEVTLTREEFEWIRGAIGYEVRFEPYRPLQLLSRLMDQWIWPVSEYQRNTES